MYHSIRRGLLITLMTTLAGAWVLAAVSSFFDTRSQIKELFDARLVQTGRVLLAVSEHDIHEQGGIGTQDSRFGQTIASDFWQHTEEKNLIFQVWTGRKHLALRSDNAPLTPLTNRASDFINVNLKGDIWRVFVLRSIDKKVVVQIGERQMVREQLTNSMVLRSLIPLLAIIPIMGLLVWFSVGSNMLPLTRIAREMSERKPNQLHPIDDSQVPVEARPLTDALNMLFARLKGAFEQERRFTADAAHELRTPLAALKTQAEVALQATDPVQQQQSLRQVVRGVNRATHLVEQLLTLARLDPETNYAERKPVDLFILGEDIISDLVPMALDKQIDIGLSGTRGKWVHVNGDAIRVLLRNLVDNAIRYTPEGGEIEVSILQQNNQILLSVADSGPGIPPEEREQVFKRFFRRLGTKAPGSGLGLSIVARIVELHQLTIALETSPSGGLQVDVTFFANPPEQHASGT